LFDDHDSDIEIFNKEESTRSLEDSGDIGEIQVNIINENENASEINDNSIPNEDAEINDNTLNEIQKEDEDEKIKEKR